ncbi:MAG: hypothetical protein GX838_01135 [Clostridiaceae bacterium]|nr:hypothetical protein [Clostridiaceae bacterium]
MKKLLAFVLLLCILLSGCSLLHGTNSTHRSSQENAYKVLRCDAQNFSVLYGKDFTAVSSEDGATIYTGDENARNKVDISVIHDGDTTSFDVTEYFHYRAEDMENKDGIKYTLSEEMTQGSTGNGVMSGAVYSFSTEDGTVYRSEMLVNTGTQLISYSCYFYEGEGEEPIKVMTDAIKSYQPSADYYDSHPLVIGGGDYTPDPDDGLQTPTPDQSQQPSNPTGMGNYQIEAAKPIISGTTRYDGGYFSVTLPVGWQIQTMGQYNSFGFRAWDPQNPDYEIFYYGTLHPFNKSQDAKSWNQSNAGYGFPYNVYGDAPVVSQDNAADLFYVWNDFASVVTKYSGTAYQAGFSFPQLNNFAVVESLPITTYFSNIATDEALIRGSFCSSCCAKCYGKFCASIYSAGTYYMGGVDMLPLSALSVSGVLAPQDSFVEVEQVLSDAIYSLNFTDSYVNEAQNYIKNTAEGYMAANASLQATYDSYNAAWSARQISYDIISQKNSDATLGCDRLYDPDTGEIYRAELGFYDSYDINRDQYSNPNLQIIDSSTENYYLDDVDYYITN